MTKSFNYNLNEIGSVSFTLNFDEDSYAEYLSDNGIGDSQQARFAFVKDYCDYDVECTDSETYHHLCYTTMTIDEIVEIFGSQMANDVLKDCMDGDEHTFEPLAYQNDEVDLNNPEQLSQAAMKYLKYGKYFKGARGFILPNGVFVYTEAEHNMCSRIPGVNGTYHFIELGCVRVLPNSLDIAKLPTKEQFNTIYQVLRCYENNTIYIDLMNDKIGNMSREYSYYYPQDVAYDISNYFKGKPMNKQRMNENKQTITITLNDINRMVYESVSRLYENKTERLRQETAHNATIEVAIKHFGNNIDVNKIIADFEETFFHGQRPSKPIIRLEPIVAELAFSFGYPKSKGSNNLSMLAGIVTYIEQQAKLGKLDIPKIASMNPQQMFETFSKYVSSESNDMKNRVESSKYGEINNEYDIIRDVTYEMANKYYKEFEKNGNPLCFAYNKTVWDWNYSMEGMNICYALFKKDFRNIKPIHDGVNEFDFLKENAYDRYGLSVIFMFVDPTGKLAYCVTRWNHGANFDPGKSCDHALNEEDISKILNVNFYNEFPPGKKGVKKFDNIIKKLESGVELKRIFNKVCMCCNDIALVKVGKLGGKYNYVLPNRKLLFPNQWFDFATCFNDEGLAGVRIGDDERTINTKGEFVY